MSRHINHRVLHQSIFCVGFNASYAFDGNNNTLWYSSGWGVHDNNDDWIGYEFPIAVRVHAVRMKIDEAHRTASPKKIFVEAADTNTGPFRTKWVIKNPTYEADNVYKILVQMSPKNLMPGKYVKILKKVSVMKYFPCSSKGLSQ